MPEHDPNRVLIFDTTLRDGEQSPGCTMTPPEKLRIARALADLGVDVIEAGFPAASRGDWESVQSIAREIEGPVIAGLARCNAEDIDRAWSAIRHAKRPRLHIFLATSAIHLQYKLNMATRGDHPRRGAGREACAVTVPGRRVLAGGCVADRARVPGRGGRGRGRGRRHHDQHPRHRRLCGARGILRDVPVSEEARAGHRQRRAERALP